MTMQNFAYEDTGDWMSFWTLFFWAWWIAWAAFVGLFLARISRGRTIRQFVAGTMILPFSYIVMWVTIFGNAALDEIRSGNDAFTAISSAANGPDQGLWALLQEYPAFPVVASLAIMVGLLFYVTSADSGALVMANLSSNLPTAETDGKPWMRIFWASATGALTLAILTAGGDNGIYALQYATVIVGLPFAFVMIAVMWGLWRALSVEARVVDSRGSALNSALSGRSWSSTERGQHVPWQARVRRAMSFPDVDDAERFVTDVACPALREVAAELRDQGVPAEVDSGALDGDRPAARLVVPAGDLLPFEYSLVHATAPVPAYGGRVSRGTDVYSRLEVHLRDGGRGYDVMGYTKTQLIDDVLDAYEAHLEFLRMQDAAR